MPGGLSFFACPTSKRNGLNVYAGRITHDGVARLLGKTYVEPLRAIAASRNREFPVD